MVQGSFLVCFCSMLVSLMWHLDHLLFGGGWVASLLPQCVSTWVRKDGQVNKWWFYGSDRVIASEHDCAFLPKWWCNWTVSELTMLTVKHKNCNNLNLIFSGPWFGVKPTCHQHTHLSRSLCCVKQWCRVTPAFVSCCITVSLLGPEGSTLQLSLFLFIYFFMRMNKHLRQTFQFGAPFNYFYPDRCWVYK